MKRLLIATATIEAGAGVALLLWPLATVGWLAGPKVVLPSLAVGLARLGGAVLLGVGVACALASRHERSRTARRLIGGMTLYNLAAAAGLCVAGVGFSQAGPLAWPAIALHAAMGGWCVASLRGARRAEQPTALPRGAA